ncbi:2-phospho-L-lactate guanylyltransferase [soil metagenome]
MKLWLLVPVKPFGEGKSRLAEHLSSEARQTLSQAMLAHVLHTGQSTHLLAGILVVSRDPQALAQAEQAGVHTLLETGHDLNEALTQASQQAVAAGAEAVLVLPADLPLLTSEDVQHLYTLGAAQPGVVITPSPDGGTNALLLHPPHIIEFIFGPNSFVRHRQQAHVAKLAVQVFESPTLALDIDWPQDLNSLQSLFAAGV